MKIPFNMEYYIDESLREIPKDRSSFSNGVDFLISQSNKVSEIERARLLSQVGVYQRICGELENSLSSLNEANSIINGNDNPRLKAVTKLRIGQTLQFLRRFDESEQLFLMLEAEIQNNDELKDLLDFVYQHHGKLHFEQKKFEESLELFEKALQLRVPKNEQELIDSTLLAIEITKRQMGQ